MIFKNFFKPKWKHNNPLIRRQAIKDLDATAAESQDIFQQLLRSDPDPVVRQDALRLTQNIELMLEVASNDVDATVREHAIQRIRRLLSGNDNDGPSLDERLALANGLSDGRLQEFLARHAKESQMREAMMTLLNRDALYGDIALQDSDPELRFKAVEQITNVTTLERVLKGVRTKDKRVRQAVQSRLSDIKATEERPEELKQQGRKLCARIDSLLLALKAEPDSIRLRSQRQEIDKEWQTIQSTWANEQLADWDGKISERYQRACESIDQLLVGYAEQAERRAETERAYEPIRQEKERIYAQLSAIQARLDVTDLGELKTSDVSGLRGDYEQLLADWKASGELSPEEMLKTNQAFHDLSNKMMRRLDDAERYFQGVVACEKLIAKLQKKSAKKAEFDNQYLKNIEKQWNAIERPQHYKLPESLLSQVQAQIDELRDQKEKIEKERLKAYSSFIDSLATLEKLLADGKSKRASSLVRQLNSHLKLLSGQDVKKLRDSGEYARFLRASGQLKDLKDWQGWASNPIREELCVEAEGLAEEIETCGVSPAYDFHAASKKIQAARQRWKSLGQMEGENCEAQWERFNAACNRAYEPCQKFFDQEAEQREQHLVAKQQLCVELESYYQEHVDGKSEGDIDWRELDRTVSNALISWRNIGQVKRKDHNAVKDRFNDALQVLKTALKAERERNKALKEELILNAEKVAAALSESDKSPQFLRDSASAIKLIQASWKEVGYAAEEKKLWNRFRAACDLVFNERQAQFDFLAEERRANLTQKENLCELIERMSELRGNDLLNARERVEEIKAEWKALGDVPQDARETIDGRYHRAVKEYNRALTTLDQLEHQQQRQALYDRHELCVQLEVLCDEFIDNQLDADEVVARLDNIRHAWDAIDLSESDDHLIGELHERFEFSIDMLSQLIEGEAIETIMSTWRQTQALSAQMKGEWCLAMEILAGVESPPEFEDARMAMQVKMLAQKHGAEVDVDVQRANSISEIEDQWYSTSSPSALETVQLERRFALARNALMKSQSTKAKQSAGGRSVSA